MDGFIIIYRTKVGGFNVIYFFDHSPIFQSGHVSVIYLFFPFEQMDNQEPTLGLLVTTVEGTEKQLSFRSGNVITKATMMVGDKVQFNIFTNSVTKEECAVNVKILPETFLTDSEEQRKIVSVLQL